MTLFVSPLKKFLKNLLNGSRAGFGSVESTIQQEILIQELSDAFDRGWDIPFGDITLSREGINLLEIIIPWSALRSFRLTKRELVIVRQLGNRFESHHVDLRRISQLPMMLHLIETQAKVKMRQLTY